MPPTRKRNTQGNRTRRRGARGKRGKMELLTSSPHTEHFGEKPDGSDMIMSASTRRNTAFAPPSVNALLQNTATAATHGELFSCESPYKVKIISPVTKKPWCADFQSAAARRAMIRAMNRRARSSRLVAPRQVLSNCWFNCMCMAHFVSDGGRTTTRGLRQMMITGVNPRTGEELSREKHYMMFLLNMCIQDIFLGGARGIVDNTNLFIQKMFDAVGEDMYAPAPGGFGNAGLYLETIARYMGFFPATIINMDGDAFAGGSLELSDGVAQFLMSHTAAPNALFLTLFDKKVPTDMGREIWFDPDAARVHLTRPPEPASALKYKLDSCIVRDLKGEHVMAFITHNGKQFAFDGETHSRMMPFKWKTRIHRVSNMTFQIAEEPQKFNFSREYRVFHYYRVNDMDSVSMEV